MKTTIKVRTEADQARYHLARKRKMLRASGRDFPDRDEVIRLSNPSFDAVLVNATNEDILGLSDEDATLIAQWPSDVEGKLSGTFLLGCFPGWNPDDVFFSEETDATVAADPNNVEVGPPSTNEVAKRGRKPATWWPEFSLQLALWGYRRGWPTSQNELIEGLLLELANNGYDVGRSSIQPVISRFYREKDAVQE